MKRAAPDAGPAKAVAGRVRIDKWLWAARFYRTRGLAALAVDSGQVRVNGARVKPAHPVRTATRVTIRKQDLAWDVEVLDTSERRGPAPQALKLYRETAESAAARERLLAERGAARAAAAPGRPTKRNRRRLEDFLNEP
ncbi:MAG TPA: RNA-binding S4 domain-containing protein [Casimicrobiaceae bacterium]